MTKSKILTVIIACALAVAVSIGATVAFLTSTDSVKNTFTVGKVSISLDEAKVNTSGEPLDASGAVVSPENAVRVKGNSYHLVPGKSYVKDPTVTVSKGSESAYVRVMVSINKTNALNAIFAGGDILSIFGGMDATKWISGATTTEGDVVTYEFRYFEAVDASGASADITLPALFSSIALPGTVTGEQLATLYSDNDALTVTVEAHAIQTVGFNSVDDAWRAFDDQVNG